MAKLTRALGWVSGGDLPLLGKTGVRAIQSFLQAEPVDDGVLRLRVEEELQADQSIRLKVRHWEN